MLTLTTRGECTNVLLVEDNENQSRALSEIITSEGFQPVTCHTGAEVLGCVEREAFVAAIIDLRLPDMSGMDLLQALRERSPQTRAIIHTGYASLSSAKQAVQLGAHAYIEKPSDPEELLRHLRRAAQEYMVDALRESEHFSQRITETVPAIIFVLDIATRAFIYLNRRTLDLLGYPPEHLIALGTPAFEAIVHREDIDAAGRRLHDWADAADGEIRVSAYRLRHADGSWRWFEFSSGIFSRDRQGRPTQLLGHGRDVTRQRQAEDQRRASDERYRRIFESATDGMLILRPDGSVAEANPAACAMHGYDRESFLAADPARLVHPDSSDASRRLIEAVSRGDRIHVEHARDLKRDGEPIDIEIHGSPIDYNGEPHILAVVRDITDRRRTEAALRESEGRFRQFAAAIDDVFWMLNVDLNRYDYVSPAFESAWGHDPAELRENAARILDAVHPDDRGHFRRAHEKMRQTGEFEIEYRVLRPDGEVLWVHDRGYPVHDAQGRLERVAGIAQDVTERKQVEARQRLMMAELNHRVKNNLTAVLSLAEQSAATAGSVEAFRTAFVGRLRAMSRAHDVLVRRHWEGFAFHEMAELVLGAFLQESPPRLRLDGRRVVLPARAATPISLALNELATNAVKHGALSATRGRVDLSWSRIGERLEARWREQGGPPVVPPRRRGGMGLDLIEGLIGYELQGQVEVNYNPEGFECRMVLPLPAGAVSRARGPIALPVITDEVA